MKLTERIIVETLKCAGIESSKELRSGIKVLSITLTGFSLSYIVRLPIDSIKIDKSFVQSIQTSTEAKTIVATIINLCKALKFKVIAEGIESRHELEYLKCNECDIGQGYYFSKPISINEIESIHITQAL